MKIGIFLQNATLNFWIKIEPGKFCLGRFWIKIDGSIGDRKLELTITKNN